MGTDVMILQGSLHEIQDDPRAARRHPGPPGGRPRLSLLHLSRLNRNCEGWRSPCHPRWVRLTLITIPGIKFLFCQSYSCSSYYPRSPNPSSQTNHFQHDLLPSNTLYPSVGAAGPTIWKLYQRLLSERNPSRAKLWTWYCVVLLSFTTFYTRALRLSLIFILAF